jgi:hypothetical protein
MGVPFQAFLRAPEFFVMQKTNSSWLLAGHFDILGKGRRKSFRR